MSDYTSQLATGPEPMRTYRVSISDRSRARTVKALDAREAVHAAVGARCLRANQNSVTTDYRTAYYDVAVRTGHTVGGATPFRNISAVVSLE